MTAAELTKYAKNYFKIKGARVNRVNNIPVRRRKGTIEKGWSDIQGYTKEGIYIACEVKTTNDRLSSEQIDRLHDIKLCGGLAFICTEEEGQPIIIEFGEFA
jgi:hypothetical protein